VTPLFFLYFFKIETQMTLTGQPVRHFELKENALTTFQNSTGKDIYLRDTIVQGFGCKVTAKDTKSFYVEVWVNGRSRRKTFGRFPAKTITEARKEAKKLIGEFADNRDSVADAKAIKAASKTLEEVLADYLSDRPNLKPRTVKDYSYVVLTEAFDTWCDRCITTITKNMVKRRHKELSVNSPARANNAMRVLRALYNYAIAEYELENGTPLVTLNPTIKLTATKTWNKLERRNSYIANDQLKAWFEAANSLTGVRVNNNAEVVRDYLVFCLLTGFRATEAAQMTWARVNFAERTFRATDTKNKSDQLLPMSDWLEEILKRRLKGSSPDATHVFPSPSTGGGISQDQRGWCKKITEASGIEFMQHDLRRTFITIAESLDIPHYALKRLVNHKSDKADVTEGYLQISAERLRKPMQAISDHIKRCAELDTPETVTELKPKRC